MCPCHDAPQRSGLTLVELLLAVSIMTVMAGVLGALATAAHQSAAYSHGHGMATQHARVAVERIAGTVSRATATEGYPGAVVLWEEADGWRFPDTLVVWHPSGPAANPAGPPLMNELVIFCPDPDSPYQLVEVTAPGDTRPVPLNETLNDDAWRAELKSVARSSTSRKVVLTNLLRAGALDGGSPRAAVRFECRLSPTSSQWASYMAGTASFSDLPWPQGMYGSRTGLRQVWVRIELQLLPEQAAGRADPHGELAIPFFGSASLYYAMHR